METVYLTRKVEFSASHRYRRGDLTPGENLQLFGKYSHHHGHNYILEVTVKGKVDPGTGMVINLIDLDRHLKAKVVEVLDHRFINLDVPHFKDRIPTPENLVLFIWDTVAEGLEGCDLHRVCLHEDPCLYVEYLGE